MNVRANPSAVPTLERTRLVDEVTTQLRELILNGEIAPGSQLLQLELAEKLGVSRTPLREAFRILEGDGLVRISNGNRTVEVVKWSPEEIREMYEIREVVDGLAARLVARNGMSKELDRELSSLLKEMEKGVAAAREEQHLPAHVRFHAAIAEHCGNSRVVALLPLVRMTGSVLHPITVHIEDEKVKAAMIEGLLHHRKVYEALKAGDEREAEKLARRHIAATLRSGLVELAGEEYEREVAQGA